jgi:WD40 repeat protein
VRACAHWPGGALEPLLAPLHPQGHKGWVTSIATHTDNPNLILSSSRDKTVLVWNVTGGEDYGYVSGLW